MIKEPMFISPRTFKGYEQYKTESNSEKPNNCENCKHHFGKDYYDIECEAKAFGNECKFEPKDEPQTERSSE